MTPHYGEAKAKRVDARVHERLLLEACDMDGVGGSRGVALASAVTCHAPALSACARGGVGGALSEVERVTSERARIQS